MARAHSRWMSLPSANTWHKNGSPEMRAITRASSWQLWTNTPAASAKLWSSSTSMSNVSTTSPSRMTSTTLWFKSPYFVPLGTGLALRKAW